MTHQPFVSTVPFPQPSFFETTVVPVPKTTKRKGTRPYTHVDYLRQRDMVFGDIEALKEKATASLLDRGWVPVLIGNGGIALAPKSEHHHTHALREGGVDMVMAPEAEALAAVSIDTVAGQFDLSVSEGDPEPQSALEAALAEGDDVPEEIAGGVMSEDEARRLYEVPIPPDRSPARVDEDDD